MRFRQRDFLARGNRSQDAGLRSNALGGNASNAGDGVLRQLSRKAEVVRLRL
jgi:hypothetical protein